MLTEKPCVQHCVHILDDFLFIGPPTCNSSKCYSPLLAFHVLAKDLGFPIKSEKTVYPCTLLTFWGLSGCFWLQSGLCQLFGRECKPQTISPTGYNKQNTLRMLEMVCKNLSY